MTICRIEPQTSCSLIQQPCHRASSSYTSDVRRIFRWLHPSNELHMPSLIMSSTRRQSLHMSTTCIPSIQNCAYFPTILNDLGIMSTTCIPSTQNCAYFPTTLNDLAIMSTTCIPSTQNCAYFPTTLNDFAIFYVESKLSPGPCRLR
jgi:hypothetical protein